MKTEAGTRLRKMALGAILTLLLILAVLAFPEIYKREKLNKINASLRDIKIDLEDPCKNILSIMQKSLFFVNRQWLPRNESNLGCTVGKSYRGNTMEVRWSINDINFHYIIDMNESEYCRTTFFFEGYPERKQPYPKNLSEQMLFFSKFLDLSYFCFDINRTNFFPDDFAGSTDLYYSDESIWLTRNRRLYRPLEKETVYIDRRIPLSECPNPVIPTMSIRDYSKNETCLKTKGKLTGDLYESREVIHGRRFPQ